MTKHIAIITVVYNNYAVLHDFIASLQTQIDHGYHLYIADASENKEPIPNISDIPHTIIPIKNKGYAHGVNECLRKANDDGLTRYCILNDDVYFGTSFTKDLDQAFSQHMGHMFGGKIWYAPGFEYHKSRYISHEVGHVIWYAGGDVDWAHATTSHRGVDEVDSGQFDTTESTHFITGCLICFDRIVFDKVGYWDEAYFLYFEDADYCARAKRNNIPLWYIPTISIWHKNAQSTDGSGSTLHQAYQKKAHFRFAMKYAPLKTKLHVLKNYFFRK